MQADSVHLHVLPVQEESLLIVKTDRAQSGGYDLCVQFLAAIHDRYLKRIQIGVIYRP